MKPSDVIRHFTMALKLHFAGKHELAQMARARAHAARAMYEAQRAIRMARAA